jgi:hypothetical protein
LENVSQKNEPLVIFRIAQCFHKIGHSRLHDRVLEIAQGDDSRLSRERRTE